LFVTGSPTSDLDVRGESVFGSGTDGVKLTYSAGNSTGIIDTGFTSTGLEFRTGNSFAAIIDSSGNVGIGTSSPTSPNDATTFIHIGNGTNQDTSIVLQDAVETWEIYQNDDLFFLFDTTNVMTLQRLTGNVGIGTGSPVTFGANTHGLTLNGTAAGQHISFQQSDSYKGSLYQTDDTIILASEIGEIKINSAAGVVINEGGSDTDFRVESVGNASMFFVDAALNSVQIGDGTADTSTLLVSKAGDQDEDAPHIRIQGNGFSGFHWLDATAYYIGQNSTARAVRIYSGAETAGVALTNGSTSWATFSDERLKYDVENVENAVDTLSGLRCVKYRLKDA
jgi:hypothetical protein